MGGRTDERLRAYKAAVAVLTTDLQAGGIGPRRIAAQIAKYLHGLGYRKPDAGAAFAETAPRPMPKP